MLCLVREGHVRVTVGAKTGLAWPMLDYSNKADVDFSTKVLDALGEIQKVAKPENWDILRPYTFINRNARGRLQPATTNDLVECLTQLRIKAVQKTPGIVEIINRYLKRIVVKRVRIADFRL